MYLCKGMYITIEVGDVPGGWSLLTDNRTWTSSTNATPDDFFEKFVGEYGSPWYT